MRSPACLDDRAAYGLAMGTLDPVTSSTAREHIDTCDSCRDLVAAVAIGAEQPPPETIGRYQIDRIIGSGAMGIVYEAADPQLERRVAIKVLRGEGHRDRLLREARAAAQISHPNVIAVFDAGIADGEVFMAMELIRGRTLRQWLEDKPRTWQAIIEVAIKAGRGLAAIHAAGLVHRDVKPDNVLVADDGRIVVTDLGLVRIEPGTRAPTGNVELTQTGALIGTPAYAAPEQLDGAGDTDARSDQFSYCVTIYEALAGTRPFDGKTLAELRASIDKDVPPIARALPATITAAIIRGLSVSPDARWGTLDELVAVLERALSPASRRRWVYLASAAGLAAATAVTVLAIRGDKQPTASCDAGTTEVASVWNPTLRDALAKAFTASGVSYARSTWEQTAQQIDAHAAQLAGAIDDACADTHVRRTQSAKVLDLRNQCLDRRRTELRVLLDVLGKPDAAQIDLAPSAVAGLVSPDACADAELLQATEPVPDAPAQREQVRAAREQLARVDALDASGRYQDALKLARELTTTADTLAYAPLVAEVAKERGRIAIDVQEWDEAKQALDRGLLAAERGRHHWVRGDVQLAIAYLALQRNQLDQALVELDRAEALVAGLGGLELNRAKVEDYRALALAKLGKLDAAKAAAEKAIALYESAEGKDTISLANPLTQLAYVEYQRGQLPSGITYLERALTVQLAAFGPDHPRIGHAHTNLAFNLSMVDKLDEAQKHAEAARAIYAASIGEDSLPYGEATRALVGIHARRGQHAESEKVAKALVDKLAPRKDSDAQRYANAVEDLAAAILAQLRHEEALPLHEEVLAIREKVLPKGHPSITSSLINIGDILADLERCKDAVDLYRRAQQGADSPDVPPYLAIAARLGQGRCLVETEQHKAALVPLREALARNATPENVDDRRLRAQTNFVLAQALAGMKQNADARAAADAAATEAAEIGIAPLADAAKKYGAGIPR